MNKKEVKTISHLKKPSVASPSEFICSESSTSVGTKVRIQESTCETSIAQVRVTTTLKANCLQRKSLTSLLAALMVKSQVSISKPKLRYV
jgi:hypothetical protein